MPVSGDPSALQASAQERLTALVISPADQGWLVSLTKDLAGPYRSDTEVTVGDIASLSPADLKRLLDDWTDTGPWEAVGPASALAPARPSSPP